MSALAEAGAAADLDATQATDRLLRHAITPPGVDSVQFAVNDVSNPLGNTRGDGEAFAQLGSAIPEVYAAYGAWLEASGNFANVYAGHGSPGYHTQTGGFLAGAAKSFTATDSLGVAVGYDHVSLSETGNASTATDDTGRLDLYGAHDFGPVTLSAAGGAAYDSISTNRAITVGVAKETHGGLEGDFGMQLSRTMQLGSVLLIPTAGFDYVHLKELGFHETGAGGADLVGRAHTTNSLQPSIGVAIAQTFDAGAWSLTPSAHASYSYEALDTKQSLIVAAQDGTQFTARGVANALHTLDTGAAISARAASNLEIYGAYNISLGIGFGFDQSVSAGMKYKF